MTSGQDSYRFGRFTLNLDPLELRDGRRLVGLPLKQLEVLSLIVRAQGDTVDRNDFLDEVWNGSFVEEANLTQTIFLLRRVLGKLSTGAQLIETVPRRGYRLSAHALDPGDGGSGYLNPHPVVTRESGQLRLLVESVEDYAIYMLDCAGRVLTWNPGAEKGKGYTSEEIIGQHFSVFFVPEDIEAQVPDRELALAARSGRFMGEGWRIRKNGDRFWASFVITAVRSPDGKLLGYGKVVRDLSERKRHDDALVRLEVLLRRERDSLRAAADGSMDAIYIFDALRGNTGDIEDFIFVYTNSNVEKMLKLSRDKLLGKSMCDLFPVNTASGLFEEYKRVVTTGVPFVCELPINEDLVNCDWVRVKAVKLNDGILVTASDISELKELQQRLSRLEGKPQPSARKRK